MFTVQVYAFKLCRRRRALEYEREKLAGAPVLVKYVIKNKINFQRTNRVCWSSPT